MGELRELSLFSGYGGLSLGLRLANLKVRTVAYVEWEKYPQEILKARIRDGFLDDAPIWGDISTFRGEQFRGLVQIISSGFPCPPFSVAGLGRGADDKRNLWPETLRVIREVRPSIVILENVPGILTASRKRGTPSYGAVVVGQLAQEGYVVRWETLGADDVGAPHRRKRWFCIGVANSISTGTRDQSRTADRGARPQDVRQGDRTASAVRTDTTGEDGQLADSQSERYRGRSGSQRGDEGRLVQSEEQGRSEVGSEAEGRNGELDDPQHIRLARPQETGSLGQGSIRIEEGQNPTEQPTGSGGSATGGQELAYTNSTESTSNPRDTSQECGLSETQRQPEHGSIVSERGSPELAYTDSQRGCGRATHWQDAEDAGQPPETQGRYGNHPIWPPRPNDTEGWVAVLNERPDLAPALTKDALAHFRGVPNGTANRVGQLKAIGNGVVPAVVGAFLRSVGITNERG